MPPSDRFGSAPASRGVAPSERSRHHAVAAIIAALSVQSSSRREERLAARRGRDLDARARAAREFAATPPREHERRCVVLVGGRDAAS